MHFVVTLSVVVALSLSLRPKSVLDLKHDRVQHSAQTLDCVESHEIVHIVLQMLLRVQLADIEHFELLGCLFFFLLDALVILFRETQHCLRSS